MLQDVETDGMDSLRNSQIASNILLNEYCGIFNGTSTHKSVGEIIK